MLWNGISHRIASHRIASNGIKWNGIEWNQAAYVQWAQGMGGMAGVGGLPQGNPLLGFGNSNPYAHSHATNNPNPNSLIGSAPNPFGMHMPPAHAKSKTDNFADLMRREVRPSASQPASQPAK